MTAITIRKLPPEVKQRLRLRAAANGRSMEAEARSIRLAALDQTQRADLTWIEQLIQVGEEVGGVELAIPEDEDATAADLQGI